MSKTTAQLSYDTLLCVFDTFADNYGTLYQFSLVNWEFNKAASGLLYRRIKLSPPFQRALDLKDRSTLPSRTSMHMFTSACIARNALSVVQLEIGGYLSIRPQPLNTLSTVLVDAIRLFTNLSSIIFTPVQYHDEVFIQSLVVLKEVENLHNLTVNSSCMGELTAPLLSKLEGLCNLTLHGPSRAILNIFPEWLGRMSKTLTGLHLKGNCGSVTPGVLRSFVPHVDHTLRELTLGLSYSLADEDVFAFIGKLRCLERLQLQYYLQLKEPSRFPTLSTLKYFTAKHVRIYAKRDVIRFCKWIRMVVAASPIESLRVICDDNDNYPQLGPNICFDNIINHLAARHSTTLRALNLRSAYLSDNALRLLFTTCTLLEELDISAGKHTMDTFQEYSRGMTRLHTAEFNIRNIKRRMFVVDQQLFTRIFSYGPGSLRRLAINGARAEAEWVSDATRNVYFVVRVLSNRTRDL
ncbi:hypothetical protein BDZ94DRAFT_1259156 [Collybia nuda]|uniref:F-box domain-containing protein n=1 Tax=Collybia nuda TaxID=64659 RepID=A0A9P5Y905_9AGAR|nr:hypothetical protein BDZ94DRAFT_1259156 [Collybia nuda]